MPIHHLLMNIFLEGNQEVLECISKSVGNTRGDKWISTFASHQSAGRQYLLERVQMTGRIVTKLMKCSTKCGTRRLSRNHKLIQQYSVILNIFAYKWKRSWFNLSWTLWGLALIQRQDLPSQKMNPSSEIKNELVKLCAKKGFCRYEHLSILFSWTCTGC